MELFTRLFGGLLVFVYHCFDRVVIHGYLSGLSRPGQVAYFFRDVVGEPVIGKGVLSRRTNEYQAWVEAFSRIHCPIEARAAGAYRRLNLPHESDHFRPVHPIRRGRLTAKSGGPILSTKVKSHNANRIML